MNLRLGKRVTAIDRAGKAVVRTHAILGGRDLRRPAAGTAIVPGGGGTSRFCTGVTTDLRDDNACGSKRVDDVTRLTEAHRLNVSIARFMELTNVMRKATDGDGKPAGSLRDGVENLAIMLSCYAPFTAEEVWSRLGHDVRSGDSVHASTWPTADPVLLVDDTVTCVVQVAGKLRDKLEVAPSISEDSLRELALASAKVQESLAGRELRTVIVRAPKLVNVVPV